MKIQYFSDMHLEFGEAEARASAADVVVAAGDIAVGAAAVEWLRRSGKPTIYVAGNHEFYGGDVDEVRAAIAAACAGTTVHYLERGRLVLDGVRFLGATLWTNFDGGDPRLMATLREHMNDYQQIRLRGRPLTPQDLFDDNTATRAWLLGELARPHPGPTVVVSHHAPFPASWRAPANSVFRAAYCNDLAALVAGHAIDLWVHGHVHACADYHVGGLHVVCNPRGYEGYQLVDGFDGARLVEV